MTKQQLTENTPVVLRATIVAGMVASLLIWFHTRLTTVEMTQVEQKTDIKYIKEGVDEIKKAVVKP